MKTDIISAAEAGPAWDSAVAECLGPRVDIFFTRQYHLLNESYESGLGEAFVARDGADIFFMPYIRRAVPDYGYGGGFSDITTPYGYGGPITNSSDPVFIAQAVDAFERFCIDSNIVTAFIRFHPLLDNSNYLKGCFEIEKNRTVVVVNLGKSVDVLTREMGNNARGAVRQALRFGLEVEVDESGETISEFIDLYYRTMDDLGATGNYYFKRSFFKAMVARHAGQLAIFNIHHKGKLILSNLNLYTGGTMHYHLSASDRGFSKLRASNLAIWEMIRWAKGRGLSTLHLGGGNEDTPDDSLFRFKQSFTRTTKPFYTGKKIFIKVQFEKMIAAWRKRTPNYALVPDSFFTKYRLREHEIGEKFTDTRIVGIGVGGHSLGILDILATDGRFRIAGLVDRKKSLNGRRFLGVKVLGSDDLLAELRAQGIGNAYIGVGGVGDNSKRKSIFDRVRSLGFETPVIAHRTTIVARSAVIGEGTILLAGTIVNANAKIGRNVILNTGSIVEHDNILGDHCHISPGAKLGGDVTIGVGAHIGIGATVLQGITIGAHTIIGAGAVVIADLPDDVVAVGVPARIVKKRFVST